MWKKILVGIGLTGGLAAGISYLLRLKRTNAELLTETTVNVHKLDLQGITLRVDAVLKNPTKTALKLKFPFVKIKYKDAVIGSSQVVNKDIDVPAFGESHIDEIMIRVPLAGVFSIASDLIDAIQGKQTVKLEVTTISTIDLGWKQLPYEKTNEVTLKN